MRKNAEKDAQEKKQGFPQCGLGHLVTPNFRPDRDENLIVTRANVNPEMWSQYEIPRIGSYVDLERSIPYDYTSVMHYGKYSFVKRDNRVST